MKKSFEQVLIRVYYTGYSRAGAPRGGGAGGTMARGPQTSGGPWASGKPMASAEGPFFWRSRNFDRKNRWDFGEDPFFWRSYHFSDQTTAFSPSILDFTKPNIRHI